MMMRTDRAAISTSNQIDPALAHSSPRPVHFAHANGYPPGCYRQLIDALRVDGPVLAMPFRPLMPGTSPHELKDWHDLVDDLITWLDQHSFQGGIGIGHSLGGVVTLLAACRRPDLFHRIVLLDPVLLPRRIYAIKSLMPRILHERLIPLSRIARRRRDHWESREEAWAHLRPKRVFGRISDAVFRDMLEAMLVEEPDGSCRLAFSKEWESRIYATVTFPWQAIRKVTVPMLVVRGAGSDTILPRSWRRLQRIRPDARYASIEDAGHLFPLEKPAEVARCIGPWIMG